MSSSKNCGSIALGALYPVMISWLRLVWLSLPCMGYRSTSKIEVLRGFLQEPHARASMGYAVVPQERQVLGFLVISLIWSRFRPA